MKERKQYENPELEVLECESSDIIRTSDTGEWDEEIM